MSWGFSSLPSHHAPAVSRLDHRLSYSFTSTFTHSSRALYLSLPVSTYSPSSIHDPPPTLDSSTSRCPALRAHSFHLSPPCMVLRATPPLSGHIGATLTRTQDQGSSSTPIIVLSIPFHLLITHPSPGFLPFQGLSPMIVRPFSQAYPLSDMIVTKPEINARLPLTSFSHTFVQKQAMKVARGMGVVWGMRGNQLGPGRSDVLTDPEIGVG